MTEPEPENTNVVASAIGGRGPDLPPDTAELVEREPRPEARPEGVVGPAEDKDEAPSGALERKDAAGPAAQ